MSSRTVPFDPDAVCDDCGATGAYDFMGDYVCSKCAEAGGDDQPAEGIHSCHPNCERVECILRREIARLNACLEQAIVNIRGLEEIQSTLTTGNATLRAQLAEVARERDALIQAGKTLLLGRTVPPSETVNALLVLTESPGALNDWLESHQL